MTPTTLEEANQLILGKIGGQSEPLILGFLPLSLAEEEAVLRLAREALSRPFASVVSLLRTAPAAMAYALAVAPGRTLTEGGRFWPALEVDLGLDVSSSSRAELAEKFRRICRSLQLIDGTIEETAWVHAAPFIFQAGILHFWKDTLATALRCTLKQVPPPDSEDPTALRRFTDELIDHVHNQPSVRNFHDRRLVVEFCEASAPSPTAGGDLPQRRRRREVAPKVSPRRIATELTGGIDVLIDSREETSIYVFEIENLA